MKHSLDLSNESNTQNHVIHVEEGPPRRSVVVSGTGDVSGNLERRCSREIEIEIVGGVPNKGRGSSASDCSVEVDQDLDRPVPETRLHLGKVERDCRICHLGLNASNLESGIPMELGCSCKNDLAAAHKHCAEAWFKIKGNKICEICGSIARSVSEANAPDLTQHQNAAEDNGTVVTVAPAGQVRRFWHGHGFLNILLATMVFAFVISWLFHFNVPS